jgi:GT2 family glycosyltransferase
MKIGFVCTNYNNSSFTRTAVASLHAGGRRTDVRVVVVDNQSREEDVASLTEMAHEFPGVELVLNPENVGYFPGLNIGIQHLRRKFPEVEHLVIGNNDLVFPEAFVETMQRHRDVFDTWAVIAPDLVTLDGVHQNPLVVYPISSIRKLIWDLHYLSFGSAVLILQAARMTRSFTVRPERASRSELFKTSGPIGMGYGACYLLGPVFFRHFAKLCAPTFMMSEEFFLSEQLKSIGQMPYYDPRFVITHHDHTTTDQLPGRRHWQISRDAHRVYKRYLAMTVEEQASFIAAGSRGARGMT